MPRWLLTMIVIDSVLIPIGVALILLGQPIPGIAVLVLDGILTVAAVVFGKGGIGGMGAEAQRNAELSASGVPGKSAAPQTSNPPSPEARIFEE